MLTRRELEIAEYVAWGASQKEIASLLYIDNDTVANHLKNIYRKLGITKATELSAWYFCHQFNISSSLSPLKRKIIAITLLVILLPSEVMVANATILRPAISRAVRVRSRVRARKNELDLIDFF
jgi:DNA-binding CsgD family transcriptional regulator